MISVYGDDSEDRLSDKSAGLVVAAMCAAPHLQWDRFLPEWRGALKRRGLSGFHMEPFVNRKESYRGWNEEEYTAQFTRVASVMGHRTTIRLAVAIDKKNYRHWIREYATGKPVSPISSYTWAVATCMVMVTSLANDRQVEQGMVFVMDAGASDFPKAAQYVAQMYQRHMNDEHLRLWSSRLLPGDVRTFPQMQTADVLAYCVREIASGRRDPHMKIYTDTLFRLAPSHYIHIHRPDQFAALQAVVDAQVKSRQRAKELALRERRRLKYDA